MGKLAKALAFIFFVAVSALIGAASKDIYDAGKLWGPNLTSYFGSAPAERRTILEVSLPQKLALLEKDDLKDAGPDVPFIAGREVIGEGGYGCCASGALDFVPYLPPQNRPSKPVRGAPNSRTAAGDGGSDGGGDAAGGCCGSLAPTKRFQQGFTGGTWSGEGGFGESGTCCDFAKPKARAKSTQAPAPVMKVSDERSGNTFSDWGWTGGDCCGLRKN